jgi:lipopolysaccharide transport system permease protein
VQYRRPLFGFLWAFIVPIFMVLIFKLVFSVVMRIDSRPYPFFIYLMTAVFPWQYFGNTLARGTSSILDNKQLIKESAFPRELIPLSVVCAYLVNFIPSVGIIFIFLAVFKVSISAYWGLLPVVILLHSIFILGATLVSSCLQVRLRDSQYCVEIIIFTFFYLTPVFYPLSLVKEHFTGVLFKLYLMNPLVGILNMYRFCFLDGFLKTLPADVGPFELVGIPIIGTVLMFWLGLFLFRREKSGFMDHISI